MVTALLLWLRTKGSRALRAAVLGVCAGLFYGLSASFAKPVINDLHVILLFDERLTPPDWHLVIALAALLAALGGAVLITLADRETPAPGGDTTSIDAPRADPAHA